MKPLLTFQTERFVVSDLGPATSVPNLLGEINIQNKTKFYLDEDDEIYEGYGKLRTSYPYRVYNCYNRNLFQKEMKTATLENDFLKAVFIPELGGRLWTLIDKRTGENLLYTNDVIRPSNLAIRNAWVSGGVEWNISMIGHTPFTMEQLFTARLENESGNPVLRMYEYERIRKVTYQMDFWLDEQDSFLNCRMRISNQTDQVVPMYWWSNMAVPEYEDGRVIAPAKEAYTNREDGVYKVPIPIVDGVDISHYKQIPSQVDYFFNIPKESPKYIANLNADGYGLLHLSTSRLQSRKLFSWGNSEASDNWQAFLTESAGRYVEIQAGLAKTQYGCIPMAPHTAWEWMELYGPVHTSKQICSADYETAEMELRKKVEEFMCKLQPEKTLLSTKILAKKSGNLLLCGNNYAAFENAIRKHNGEELLDSWLEFKGTEGEYKELLEFLETGIFPEPLPIKAPFDFISDETIHQKLLESIETINAKNWYAHYQLGLSFWFKNHIEIAQKYFQCSNTLKENPWALHALSVLSLKNYDYEDAVSYIVRGYSLKKDDLSYLKETWKILLLSKAYDSVIDLYKTLPEEFANESRLYFGYLTALARTGYEKEVLRIMTDTNVVLDDLRECEDTLSGLWAEVYEKVHHEKGCVPARYNYNSLK